MPGGNGRGGSDWLAIVWLYIGEFKKIRLGEGKRIGLEDELLNNLQVFVVTRGCRYREANPEEEHYRLSSLDIPSPHHHLMIEEGTIGRKLSTHKSLDLLKILYRNEDNDKDRMRISATWWNSCLLQGRHLTWKPKEEQQAPSIDHDNRIIGM